MLTKRSNGVANGPRLTKAFAGVVGDAVDRRTFLKRSGLTVGGIAAASGLSLGMVKKAEAQSANAGAVSIVKTICPFCAVGCTSSIRVPPAERKAVRTPSVGTSSLPSCFMPRTSRKKRVAASRSTTAIATWSRPRGARPDAGGVSVFRSFDSSCAGTFLSLL